MKNNWISIQRARQADAIGTVAQIRGWVRTRRDSKGGFSFIEVNDGSCFGNLQIVADGTLPNYQSDVTSLTVGSSVVITGEIKASAGQGQATEMFAHELQVTGTASATEYPLQKKQHTFEKLREWAHLRPRTNTFGAVARVRNRLSYATHSFYQQEGFLYVHTPVITASDCEGAGQMFRVTTLPLDKLPMVAGKVDTAQDFFGKSSYLTVSGQLEGEAYATALGKIYTFGPTFRAENSNTSRHLSEFWMIEPEMAFFDLNDNMDLAERYLKYMLRDLLSHCGEDMDFFEKRIQPGLLASLQLVLDKPFTHLSYTEAVAILQASEEKFEYPVSWGVDLQAEHERYITEKHVQGPVILYNYPKEIKSFYMRLNDDGKTVAAMDVLVPGVGEIIGGSQRDERLDVLTDRMVESGLNPDDYWWYLDLRRYGTVPHAGFGLGLERMVQYSTGMTNIRDVIPFPRTPGNCEF
ncbi:MAG: asparagine--tRNA ligase [Pirellula sp.]|jgi:asparaginyl-tRNA synthetase|nr:asparagine--tRNA ligase [Pirellula sp.]